MQVLVTGASGYLGSHLSRALHASGIEVLALTRSPSSLLQGIKTFIGESNWQEAFDAKPDAVCNLAGAFTPDLSKGAQDVFDSNFGFPQKILERALAAGIKNWIQVGTYWQFASDGSVAPQNTYAALKQAFMDELKVVTKLTDFKVLNLILFDIYGPQDWRQKLIPSLLRAIKGSQEFSITAGEQHVSFVNLEDVINAFKMSLSRISGDSSKFETFFVYDEVRPLKEFVHEFLRITKNRPILSWGTKPYDTHHILHPHQGQRLPGWSARIPFENGIKDLLNE